MKEQFTALIEAAPGGGFVAACSEIPGAGGQGETVAEAKASLAESIRLILTDRAKTAQPSSPGGAIQEILNSMPGDWL